MSTQVVRAQIGTFNLGDLTDASIPTPVTGYTVSYNGSAWNATPLTAISGRSGMNFYLDTTGITAASNQNFYAIKTLSKTPVVSTVEQSVTTAITNTTVPLNAYLLNSALGKTSFDAGEWLLGTYARIDSLAGSGTAEIITSVKRAVPYSGGILATTSGTGTTRQLDVAGATPFDGSEFNADATLAGYIRTPNGCYQITAVIGGSTIQIAVPSTYTNETNVAFSIWRQAFNLTTGNITTTTLTLYPGIPYPKAAITTLATDEIAVIVFIKSTYTTGKAITYTSNGTAHNSYISTPLIEIHDNLPGVFAVSATENYGHLGFGADTIYGVKTFDSAPVFSTTTLSGQILAVDTGGTHGLANIPFYYTGAGLILNAVSPYFFIHESTANAQSGLTISAAGNTIGGLLFHNATGAAVLNIDANPASISYASTINYGSQTTASGITHNFTGTVTANVTGSATGFLINATTGYAIFKINQNNAALAYAGFNVQRQGVEKWFVGMDGSADNLIFRRTASTNDAYIDTTGKMFINAASFTTSCFFACSPVMSLSSAFYCSAAAGGTDGDWRLYTVGGKPHLQQRVSGTYVDILWNS